MTGHYLRADRLNVEPPIFRGCSSSELVGLMVAGALFWLPMGMTLAFLVGALTLGMGLAGMAIAATVYFGTTLLRRIKRNRPEGYYRLRFVLWMQDRRLYRSPFIRHHGPLDLGRRLPRRPLRRVRSRR